MPFSPKLLNEGEQIILDLKPHPWFMARATGALVGALILGLLVYRASPDNEFGSGLNWLVALIILFCLGWFAIRYMKWVSTQFVLTTARVIHRVGVVSKRGIEIPLERINTVFFRQTFFERVLGAGNLGIESAGERGEERFRYIRKPSVVQNEIYKQMEANAMRVYGRGGAGAGVTQPASDASIPDQLDRLDDLRKRGVISEAEFQQKKTELLGRM